MASQPPPAVVPRGWLRALYLLSILVGRVALLAGLLLALVTQVLARQTVRLPEGHGPFAVGRAAFDWTDAARADPLGQDPALKRELLVWVWYPATPGPGAAPASYLPGPWRQRLQQRSNPLFTQDLAAVRVHAVADAPPAPGPFPVVIMSPGFGLLPTDLTTLAEDLASRGYIVAGIAPTFIAPVVVFPDGRVVAQAAAVRAWGNETAPAAIKAYGDQLVNIWAQDTRFVMDQLAALNRAPGSPFTGQLDLARLGVFGHSLGGAVALQACHLDNRCRAGIDLDGAPYGDVIAAGVQQPFMFMLSEPQPGCDALCAQIASDIQSIYTRLPQGGYRLTTTGFRHFNFTDLALSYAPLAKPAGLLGSIDGQRGLRLSSDYIAAFFDHYLQGRAAPLLAGPSPAYPEVHLERR